MYSVILCIGNTMFKCSQSILKNNISSKRHYHCTNHLPMLLDISLPCAKDDIHAEACHGNRSCAHQSAQDRKEQVGDDDGERRKADNQLDHEAALVSEMRPDYAKCRCHGSASHYCKKGDRKNSESKFPVFLSHKRLC